MSNQLSIAGQFEPSINVQNREEFLKRLNENPDKTYRQSDYAKIPDKGEYETIPIDIIETTLDEVYMGLWETTNFHYQVMANEIVGHLDLRVFDPSAKVWLTRLGFGAVTIRQKKDSDITDISAKIKTALQMDFPKLRTACIKNAAKTLGAKFGRHLNRKFEDSYETIYSDEIELAPKLEELQSKMKECKTKEELTALWKQYPNLHENSAAKKHFRSHNSKLALNVKP